MALRPIMKRTESKIQVFISYRRENGADLARLVWETLHRRGFVAFMDVEDLRSGPFNTSLYARIEEATDFVVILTPHALDRCQNEGDWLRLELTHAFQTKKNIIPVITRGFQWPEPGQLPTDLAKLPSQQGVTHSHELFRGSMDKLEQLLAARPRRRISFQLVGIFIALLIGGWFLVRGYKPTAENPVPSSATPSSPGVTLDDYVKVKTEANAVWERIKFIERGSGFGVLLDQAQQQQHLAAEYDMRKADVQASAAYQQLLQMCRNLEEKQQVRLQVQASCQETENLMRQTDAAFKGSLRSSSFEKGKQALSIAVSYLADGNFESAKIQLAKATEQFSTARTESERFNSMSEAQERWITSLAAADEKLLNEFAAAQFRAAKAKAADAQAKVLAGQIDAAIAQFNQAVSVLREALESAKTLANTAMAEAQETWTKALAAADEKLLNEFAAAPFRDAKAKAADAKSKILTGQFETVVAEFKLATAALAEALAGARGKASTIRITPVPPAPAPPRPADDVRAYLSGKSFTADPLRGQFDEVRNRFHPANTNEVFDVQLRKTWVLYDPNKIMDWDTARVAAEQAGGRLPLLSELKTLLTKGGNPDDWANINTLVFPPHQRTTRFWTSAHVLLGLPNTYVDFKQAKWVKCSGGDQCAVLIIRDK